MNKSPWHNTTVLVTGHTGFKGGWLCIWLKLLGAEVHGISLDPLTSPNLYTEAQIADCVDTDSRIDIRNREKLIKKVRLIKPDVLFHLAAQPLVLESYTHAAETFETNVMGVVNILEAIRACNSIRAAIIVTSDKCYLNDERKKPYIESDRLGGKDPYSNSKSCAELVIMSYRDSFFSTIDSANIASVRAGNVIGGGDWSDNRLIPDLIRSHFNSEVLHLRYPNAIRPWQHVLDPLNGYILLAEKLYGHDGYMYAQAWNFGSRIDSVKTVREVVDISQYICDVNILMMEGTDNLNEATYLLLDSSKAERKLKWLPTWNIYQSIKETMTWYEKWNDGVDARSLITAQIMNFNNDIFIKQSQSG